MSKLSFKYGAMNCGKSDTLIKTAYNYTERGLSVVTMMPGFSMKKDGFITARAGGEWPIDIVTDNETNIYDEYHRHIGSRAIHCVLADEAQFMTPAQIEDLEKIAKVDGTSVVAFGIRTNIRRELFEGSKKLFELADTLEKLPTMCRCGVQAEFNARFVNDKFFIGDPIVMIDGRDGNVRYESMCSGCYLQHAKS